MGAQATSVDYTASEDSYLDQANPSTNYGTDTELKCKSYTASNSQRFVLTFDLSGIPSNAIITSAILTLIPTTTSGDDRTISAHRVTDTWTEGPVTWANTATDFDATATSTSFLEWTGSLPASALWTVTTDVQDFVDGVEINYGWLLKDNSEDASQSSWFFGSDENLTSSNRPKLTVVYIVPGVKANNTTDLDQGGSWVDGSIQLANEGVQWENTVTGANTVALGSNLEFRAIEIVNPGGAVTINAGNTLTLGAGGIVMGSSTQNLTLNTPLVLNGNQSWTVATSKTITSTGVVSGSNTITKEGAGSLSLSGTNTFTGGVTHNAGTLNIESVNALGTTAGTLTIAAGTTIDNTSGGVLVTDNYPITLNGSFVFTGTDELNLGSGATLLTSDITITAGAALTFDGVVSGAHSIYKEGIGNVYLNNEANTYTGKTTIAQTSSSDGALYYKTIANVGDTCSLGAPTTIPNGTIAIGSGSYGGNLISVATSDQSTDRVIDLASTTGEVQLDAGDNANITFTSDLTATGAGSKTLAFRGTTVSNEIEGVIVNNSGSNLTSVDKRESGTWILSGDNTYTGTTTITDGTLQIGNGGTTGSLASTSIVNSGVLNINRSDELTYSGIISSTGAVVKKGTGTLILDGVNVYTGTTTLTGGALQLGGAGVIADGSSLELNGGGLITGDGAGYSETFGPLVLSNTSIITLGTGNHTLTFSSSSSQVWVADKEIEIRNWVGGYNGSAASGANPKIFIGASATLSIAKLGQIKFRNGLVKWSAAQLASGEIVANLITLPVELVHFDGSEFNDNVQLTWSTASEINSDYFEIFRADEALNFVSIGTVSAAGNSSDFINYEYFDYEANSGINYYKIIEYDYDGTEQESRIIKILTLKLITLDFLHKNNNDEYLFQLSLLEEMYGTVNVLNINGQIVQTALIIANKGNNKFVVNSSLLDNGYHILVVKSDGMPTKSVKFLVH